jgi:hypothetical protein
LLFLPLARPLWRLLLILLFALWRRLRHDQRLVERGGVDGSPHHGRQHRPHQKAHFDQIPFWVGKDARDFLHQYCPRIAKVGGALTSDSPHPLEIPALNGTA